MSNQDQGKFDNYYESCFAGTKLHSPKESFDHYRRSFDWLLPADKQCRLLDFGAGLGNLTLWLMSQGYQSITSIDVSKDQCAVAQEFGANVIHVPDSLSYLIEEKGSFDVIFLSDVIEHIPKSQMMDYMSAAKDALVEGGMLVVKTENVSSPTGIYQHHMDFTHEYNFVEKSLRQLLMMVGFREVEIRGPSMPWPRRPWLWWKPIVRMIYIGLIRVIYAAEQPRGDNNPRIFSNSLVARAYRK
jgi:2-polyprenyl-3-methyl-5-hydroxy-6-metoxy-1,4-benzoquinol methylase